MKHINGNHIKPFFVLLWEVSTTDDREDHKQFILMFYSYLFTTLNKLLLWDISLIFTLITYMVIRNWGFVFLVVVVFLFCFFIFLYILPWTALWITFNDFFLYIMRCRFHFHIRILKVLLRNIQCINLGETGMLNLHFILYVLKTCCFSINLNSHHSSPVSFVYCKVQKMFFKCSLYRPVFVLDNIWFFFLSFIAFFFCDRTNDNNYRQIRTPRYRPLGLPAIRQSQSNNQETGNRQIQIY